MTNLYPQYQQWKMLNEKKLMLDESKIIKLTHINHDQTFQFTSISKSEYFSELTHLLRKNHIWIHILREQNPQLIQVKLESEWQNLFNFLHDLLSSTYAFQVQDFTFNIKNNLIFTGNIYVLNDVKLSKTLAFFKFHPSQNPFCMLDEIDFNHDDLLKITPLNELKMVGFLQQKSSFGALILLPNEQIVLVKKGDIIAKEGAHIELIEPNRILFKLPNGKTLTIIR